MINFDRFPGGTRKILTMSYDDGKYYDRQLVEIFNKYGIRGTFHINAGYLNDKSKDRIDDTEVAELYAGHEISAHGFTHRSLGIVPRELQAADVWQDRLALEKLAGYDAKVVLIEKQAPKPLVDALRANGYSVALIDILSTHRESEGFDGYIQAQINNAREIRRAFDREDMN